MTTPSYSDASRLAFRYLNAAGTEQDIQEHIHPFRAAYEDMANAIDMARKAGYGGDSLIARSQANAPWVRLMKHGRKLADAILTTRSIPAKSAKGMEMAYRLFANSRRMPKDVFKWWAKNQRRLDVTIQAATKWPAKVEGGDELFVVGSFRIHNVVGASGKKLARIKAIIAMAEKAARTNPVPGFDRVVYGDIHIVNRITKAHHAAWYHSGDDSVYLRLARETDKGIAQSVVHELGHRYWAKFADKERKAEWRRHHINATHQDADVVMPSPGDEVPVKFRGQKGPAVLVREDNGLYYVKAVVKGVEQEGTVAKYSIYKILREQAKREQNFPTAYASTHPEEHFCESLKLRSFRQLPADHRAEFDRVWG